MDKLNISKTSNILQYPGIASTVVPVYISEAAPVHMRGSLTVSYNTLVVAGQFVATLVCGAFAEEDQGWRWMLGLAGVPAVVQFIGETYYNMIVT